MPKGRECVHTVMRIGEEQTCAGVERACSFLPLCRTNRCELERLLCAYTKDGARYLNTLTEK